MAKRSRYKAYLDGIAEIQEKQRRQKEISSTKSVLGKLKKMKNREFIMKVPVGDSDGK